MRSNAGGIVVAYVPATDETRVRFPAGVFVLRRCYILTVFILCITHVTVQRKPDTWQRKERNCFVNAIRVFMLGTIILKWVHVLKLI